MGGAAHFRIVIIASLAGILFGFDPAVTFPVGPTVTTWVTVCMRGAQAVALIGACLVSDTGV